MFTEKDICLILNTKLNQWRSRWMGTIPSSKGTKKMVMVTTVTGNKTQAVQKIETENRNDLDIVVKHQYDEYFINFIFMGRRSIFYYL